MAYICMDRGTDKCPCELMEAGQCYTCGMIQTGKCDCEAGWQGVCPYTEYVQRGKKAVPGKETRFFTVERRTDYSSELTTVTLRVPFAYGIKCRSLGAFIMAESAGWQVPLSVMENIEDQEGHICVAINAAGPKTKGLLKSTSVGSVWKVKGPYYSGLVNREVYEPAALSVVMAKGLSLMPFINIKDRIAGNMASFYLDSSKLPDDFTEKYIGELDWQEIDLETQTESAAEHIAADYDYCVRCTGMEPNVFLLVSPYFAERITALLPERVTRGKGLILPNHSNMCCGEGLCGACSHTDKDGVTVRGCKCFEMT